MKHIIIFSGWIDYGLKTVAPNQISSLSFCTLIMKPSRREERTWIWNDIFNKINHFTQLVKSTLIPEVKP